MLKRWLGAVITLLMTATAVAVSGPLAVAQTCVPARVSTWGGTWRVEVECRGDPIPAPPASNPPTTGTAYCTNAKGYVLPCAGPQDTWFDSVKQCHVNVASINPSDPIWAEAWRGRTTGAILNCIMFGPTGEILEQSTFWAQSATPEPGPATVEEAVEGFLEGAVEAPQIGVFPGGLVDPAVPEAMGVIGVPAWFWAKNPGEGIANFMVSRVAVGDWSLRVRVSLDHIDYDTDDGESVRCWLGDDPTGRIHEPTRPWHGCGHTYMEKGDYTITATTYVKLHWDVADEHGDVVFALEPRTGVYHVGEIQVVIVNR